MDEAAVLRLIDALYEAALRPEAWRPFLDSLCATMGGVAGGIHIRSFQPVEKAEQIWVGLDPEFEKAYLAHYWRQDPWFPAGHKVPPGTCLLSEEVIHDRELVRTEFYNDLCRKYGYHHLHGGPVIRVPGELTVTFGMFRPVDAAPFDEGDRRFLQTLMPHLQRAVLIGRNLAEARDARAGLERVIDSLPVGVIHLDDRGRIVRTNPAADEILRESDGLSREGDALRTPRPATTNALRAAIEAGRGAIRLPRPSGRTALAAIAVPIRGETADALRPRPATALFLMDPAVRIRTPANLLRSFFGLTPAEARLALIFGEGATVKDAAERLGVAVATVRYQLRQIFAKTRTDRQSALVRLLVLLGVLPDDGGRPRPAAA